MPFSESMGPPSRLWRSQPGSLGTLCNLLCPFAYGDIRTQTEQIRHTVSVIGLGSTAPSGRTRFRRSQLFLHHDSLPEPHHFR